MEIQKIEVVHFAKYKDALTSIGQASTVGKALDSWSSDHLVEP